jgi:hypothetical protein
LVAVLGRFTERLHPRGHGGKFVKGLPRIQTVKDRNRATSTMARFRHHILTRQTAAAYHVEHGPSLPEHREAVGRYFAGGFRDVNAAMREGRDHPDIEAVAASFKPLQHDLVVSRRVEPTAFGLDSSDGVKDLIGKKVKDAAFQAASLHDEYDQPGITMHIAVPKGVPAAVSPDGQILLDRDTELAIVDAAPNGHGGWEIHAVLLKKPVPRGKKAEPAGPVEPAAPKADEADLSKMTVAQLQRKVREAGKRPGRLRKAELIALLQGDGEQKAAPASKPAAKPTAPKPVASAVPKAPTKPKPEPAKKPAPPTGPPSAPEITLPHSDHKIARGRDLTKVVGIEHSLDTAAAAMSDDHAADKQLRAIMDRQGFDGLPRAVSETEMFDLINSGTYKELFRGALATEYHDAAWVHDQFRNGNAYGGFGVYGNGYYFAVSNEVATAYSNETPGSVLHIGLHRDAKVIDYDRIPSIQTDDRKIFGDPGRVAAALGYDAIRVPRESRHGGDYYVVLNRTATVVQKAAEAQPEQPPEAGAPGIPSASAPDLGSLVASLEGLDQVVASGRFHDAARLAVNGNYAGLDVAVKRGGVLPGSGGKTLQFHGTISDSTGNEVGTFIRTISQDPDGKLVAHNDLLAIDKRVQGSGFARAFNHNLIEWYRRSGVDRIELNANIDVGGYAWASQGYDFASPRAFFSWAAEAKLKVHKLYQQQESLAEELGVPVDKVGALLDQFRALLERAAEGEPISAYEFSQAGRSPGDSTWLGKLVMLGTSWDGVLRL